MITPLPVPLLQGPLVRIQEQSRGVLLLTCDDCGPVAQVVPAHPRVRWLLFRLMPRQMQRRDAERCAAASTIGFNHLIRHHLPRPAAS